MKKSNIYLIVVFAVLLVVTLLVLNKQSGDYSSDEIIEKFVTADSAAIDKIEIQNGSQITIIEKNAGEWRITSPVVYPADQENIKRILSTLKSGKLTTSVSSNPEKQSLYQVDSAAIKVSLYEKGNKKDALYIGKPGSDYTSTFVRKENSKEVFLVNKALSYDFRKSVNEWRDKIIFKVPVSTINEVKFEYGDTVFILKKVQSSWFIDADSLKTNKIEPFLSAVSGLIAEDFIDTAIVLPAKTLVKISVSTSYMEEIRLYAQSGNQNNYLVQTSKGPQVFVVGSYSGNNLMKRKKDF